VHKDTIFALDFSPDSKYLASGGADKSVRVLDTSTWRPIKLMEGHTSHVLGLSWRHEGRTLASAGAEGTIKIWDFLTGDRKRNIDGWEGEVTGVQFAGYSGNMITSSADKRIRLVPDTGGELRAFAGCEDFMQGAAISADGRIVVAGGIDGVLRVWDGTTGNALAAFKE